MMDAAISSEGACRLRQMSDVQFCRTHLACVRKKSVEPRTYVCVFHVHAAVSPENHAVMFDCLGNMLVCDRRVGPQRQEEIGHALESHLATPLCPGLVKHRVRVGCELRVVRLDPVEMAAAAARRAIVLSAS